ncbi:FkbH-like protein [Streptacidiphilus sp. MAP12-20]|uniref:HAD-IIIC family phosphatase n=1 Tax=Streptacidiphilus sp. MAP12-20 TaxID=3156299 RepID=UPI003517E225
MRPEPAAEVQYAEVQYAKVQRAKVKCVVWDLDDTLWEGVLAEGAAEALRPGVEKLLHTLDQRGVLHAVASKNEPGRALARLAELGVADLFVCPQISWEPKSELVARVAQRLNIGLDTLMFVDDSPFERAEVAAAHPQVRCLDAAELEGLADRPEFDLPVTAEAARRRQLYQEADVRRDYEETFEGPRTEFLASLGMRLTVAPAAAADLLRAAELTERTHQLNTTGLVFSAADLAGLIPSTEQKLLVVGLEDTFGSYGAVGLVLLAVRPGEWCIRLFLMSCRVMGRNVGGAVLAFLAQQADARGRLLTADFAPNEVNRPMYLVYRLAGFEPVETTSTEATAETAEAAETADLPQPVPGGVQRLRLRPGLGRTVPEYLDLDARLD